MSIRPSFQRFSPNKIADSVKSLKFGIEHEAFILRSGGAPTYTDIADLFMELCSTHGFVVHERDASGQPLVVNRDVDKGYISIKNDYCTHILETSLPPSESLQELEQVFADTWGILDDLLQKRGISRAPGAALTELPQNWTTIPSPRLAWFRTRVAPQPPPEFWHRDFGALICATQIHLNILNSDFFSSLPKLYSFEYLTPLLYSRSRQFGAKRAYCARPLVYRDNYPRSYLANGFPSPVPNTAADYNALLSKTPDFIRDYTFIAPRKFGTIEFRTGCSQDRFSDIASMIALRVASAVAATHADSLPRTAQNEFFEVCETGYVQADILREDFKELETVAELLPSQWHAPFLENKRRAEEHLGR